MQILHSRAEQTRDLLMHKLRALMDSGVQNIVVIVPEQITLQTELDIVDALDINGSFIVQVMSPNKLYSRVFAAAGEPEGVPIDERGRGMLLGAAISDIKSELKWFAGVSDKPGFTARALEQLSQLKNAGVMPEQLAEISAQADNTALGAKLGDISRIYAAYDAALGGHFADSADRQRECLLRMEYAEFLNGAQVIMYGFDMITPPIERLIVALSQKVENVMLIIALPEKSARDYEIYAGVAMSLNRLSAALSTRHVSVEIKSQSDVNRTSEIDFLRRELFAHPANKWPRQPAAIRLQLLRDPFDEAMEVAARARELAMAGMRWRDMAVISPRMEEYGHLLERAFALYDVPLFMAKSRTLAGEPLPRYLLSALRAISRGFRQEDMLDCLKSGFGMPDAETQKLENYIEQFGINGRKFLSPFKRGGAELLDEIEPMRVKFIAPLNSLRMRLQSADNMGEQAKALFMLLDEQAALDSLKARSDELLDGALRRDRKYTRRMVEAAYNAQVWNKLMGLLDQLYMLLGDRPADIELLQTLTRSALECDEVRILPQSGDAVMAGKLGGIKMNDVKIIFAIGMQDMAPESAQELLSDDERADIEGELRVSLGMNTKHKQLMKSVDLMSALASSRRFAIFTYAMNGADGRSERPGDVILRLKRVFPELKTQGVLDAQKSLNSRMSSAAAALEQIAPLSRRGLIDGSLPDAALRAWTALYKLPGGGAGVIERALTHDIHSENLLPVLTRKLYHGLKSVSITRLEQHARCPFAEFVRYGLKPVQNLKYEIQPRDKGMFYHEAVEKFTRQVIAGGGFEAFDAPQLLELMDRITLELERKWGELIPLGEDSLMRARSRDMIRTAKRSAMAMARQMSGSMFGPAMLEVDFGQAGELTLKMPGGDLRVRGRIDRVDLMSAGQMRCLRVIDYKLGGKSVSLSDMYYGLQLQLLTYLCAALNIKPDFQPAAALYFAVKDPVIDADELSDEQLEMERVKKLRMSGLVVNDPEMITSIAEHPEEVIPVRFTKNGELYKVNWLVTREDLALLMKHTCEMICRIAYDIRQGVTDIEPCVANGQIVCQYCDFKGICQFAPELPGAHINKLDKLSADDVLEYLHKESESEE